MSEIIGIEIPVGFKLLNPEPLNSWEGPYTSIEDALTSIPIDTRYLTMELKILDPINGNKKYWFKDGIEDTDLVYFGSDLSMILTGETANRIAADLVLQNNINNLSVDLTGETANRISADNLLTNNINDLSIALTGETASRIETDFELNNSIANVKLDLTGETASRIYSDLDLQNKIDNLDLNISNNYTELSTDLNNLTDTVSDNYTILNDKINSEIGNRENSDVNLSDQISGETNSRVDADIIINTRIDNVELIGANNYIDLQNQITGESATRQIQDENLANEFTGLTEQVMQAHMVFANEISGETANRIAADTLLTNDLNDLTDLINQSHIVFNNEISGETINRIAGDISLQSQINDEINNRISKDLLKADLTGATFSGDITATNLIGYNSGDQDISNLIPFTGATKNVDLGDKSITVETLVLNPEPTINGFKEGVIFYDKPNKTVSAMIDHEVTLQIGQEELALCFNNTGIDIPNGSIVYQTGAYGDMPTIALAKADSDSTSIIIGMSTQIIYANDSGFITVRGIIHDINTIGFSSSTTLYLSPFIAGGYTDIVPTDSSHFTVKIGTVLLHNDVSGSVYVQQSNNVKLSELLDVAISNPKLDEIIRYNGINWVNGAPSTSSSSPGIGFFPDRTKIISGSSENFFSLETLNKYPVIRTETIDSIDCTEANVPVLGGGYLYNTPLNRTVIDPGNWSFNFFLSASSISDGRESTVINNMYKVSQYNGLTITDSGTSTIRNVVASGDSPFSIDKIDVTGIITEDSFIQTPKGVYQILSRISDTEITILTPTGYTNETNVEFFIFKKLFASYSPIITTIGINYGLYSIQSSQEAFTILETDKLAMLIFANNTTNDPTTINYIYNDQDSYSHITSPLSTLHNDLAGLQGGNLTEKYHLTLTQYGNVNNLTGINTGNQLPDNVTIIGSGSPVSPFTVPSLNGITSNVQSQINTKLDKNIDITGATHTKITYDSKGLVTSAVDALTSDVNDSLDRRYVTDQEKVNISYLTGLTSNVQQHIIDETINRVNQDIMLGNLITGETANRVIADLLKADLTGATFSGDITATNLIGYNSGDQTLVGLGGQPKITGTGFVKSIGDVISFDNSTYYLASNPNNYINSINNGMVIGALGYTPYNSTNPNGYISSYIDTITRVSGTNGSYVSGDVLIQGIGKITTSQSSNTITIASATYSASDVGLGNVTNNPQWYSGNHPTTLSGYGITDTPWLSYLGLTGGTMVSGSNIFNPNDISNGAIGFNLTNNSFGSITFPTIIKSSINPNIIIGSNTYGIIHDGNLFTSINSNFVVGANSTVLNTDSLNAAIGKLQGQINNKQTSGSYLTGTKVDSFNTRTGAVTLSSSDITTALTFTPYNSTNPNGYTNNAGTVTSITAGSGLSGGVITTTGTISLTSGITTVGTYKSVTVDTYGRITAGTNPTTVAGYGITDAVTGTPWTSMGYLTSISSAQVTGALGFTPYNSTNPNGYIAGINSGMVTSALGYTPYNSTNPSGYITGINSGMVTSALGYTPWYSGNHPTTLSGYGITDTPWGNYLPLNGGNVTGKSWFTYGQTSNSTYSWVDAALTTNSIEIVANVNSSGGNPTLSFHTWGTGGAQFRMSGDNVLHIESAYANSARVAASSGTSYFDYLNIYSRNSIGIYINGNGVVHDGNIGSKSVNYSNSAGSISNFTVRVDRSDSNDYNLAGRGTGIYAIAGGGSNGPGSVYLDLLHMTNSSDVAFQIAGGYVSDSMYFRGTSNLGSGTNYTPWRTVIHSGNISSQTVSKADNVYNTSGNYMNFRWSAPGGSPTYVWGITNGVDNYLYEPYNLLVHHSDISDYSTNSGTATYVRKDFSGSNSGDLLYSQMADNDQFRLRIGGTSTNAGYVEFATADDGTEPFYFRQYTGVFGSLVRTLTLLDESGNTNIPGTLTTGGNITANIITSKASQTSSYVTAALWTQSFDNTLTGIAFHISGVVGKMLYMNTDQNLYWAGNRIIDSSIIGSQSVNYAASSNAANYATYLPTAYAGGQQLNPQTYFNSNIGLKVAMTAYAGVLSDTLWINGYGGSDVPDMIALHFARNGQPRMYISSQYSTATSYGTNYEIISTWNIASQKVDGSMKLWSESHPTNYYLKNNWDGTYWQLTSNHSAGVSVNHADNVPWGGVSSKPSTLGGYGINDWVYGDYGSVDNVNGISGCYYFAGNSPIPGESDGTLWNHAYTHAPTTWGSQLVQNYRDGRIYVRGRNNGGWSGWLTVIDSGTIGSQSVNYANSSGTAGTSSYVNINYNNDANSTYQMLWGSGTAIYGTSGIYCNPATDVIYAYTFQLTSDIRSKQNISLIDYKPIEVDIKEYEFKNNPGKKHYGVIAQEVVVNHPELVEEDSDGKLSVNYIDLIMLELSNLRKEIKILKEKYECT